MCAPKGNTQLEPLVPSGSSGSGLQFTISVPHALAAGSASWLAWQCCGGACHGALFPAYGGVQRCMQQWAHSGKSALPAVCALHMGVCMWWHMLPLEAALLRRAWSCVPVRTNGFACCLLKRRCTGPSSLSGLRRW